MQSIPWPIASAWARSSKPRSENWVSARTSDFSVFVLPALEVPGDVEGFGIVFLEAAQASTPSVATKIGGIPDAVEDGVTGLLVEPGDYVQMTHAIVRLLEDSELRERLARQGRVRVQRSFGWGTITGHHVRVLEDVVQERARARKGRASA